ncbi:hypothetical protein [Haladaptatus sp. DYF46]|uniref:DUF7344 domain-containing protein n=1 Tax=Haladaptatus sp. DYF46 TaxID=2886041 RepID=UPI001E3731BD|nr:hypothetical protein [Haladaptatus sp. DYF46]
MSAPLHTDDPLTPNLTLSAASKILKKSIRRAIIRYFTAEKTATAQLAELVTYVYKGVDDITGTEQARIALVHTHLPILADHEIIDYDERSKTVRYRNSKRLKQLLEISDTHESPNETTHAYGSNE